MPILGDPDAVLGASEELVAAAKDLQVARDALAARGRTVSDDWHGRAASAALDTIERHATDLQRAVDAVAISAVPLARYAEALRAAQRDHALGEQMARDGEAARAGVGSGAVAASDVARDDAIQTITDGSSVMASAEDRAREANELAARALADATAGVATIAPPPALGPVVGRDGTLGDGLVKSLGDVSSELVESVSGLAALLDPSSDGFGPAWAHTWETTTAVVSDPVGAARTVLVGTVAPVGESYDTGGIDEAIGRTPTVLAGVIGTKGLTKLTKLRKLRNENLTPLAPDGGLGHHENAGGHTLAPYKVHIGTDEEALFNRVRSNPHISAASSYFDRAIAEKSIRENLDANQAAIDDWLRNTNGNAKGFELDHEQNVGVSVDRNATSAGQAIEVQRSRVVLRRDPTQSDGYYILTSHPTR